MENESKKKEKQQKNKGNSVPLNENGKGKKPVKSKMLDEASDKPVKNPAVKADPEQIAEQTHMESTHKTHKDMSNDGPVVVHSLMSDFDVHLFREGRHFKLYEKLGSHVMEVNGQKGTFFGVWAPNAKKVSVV